MIFVLFLFYPSTNNGIAVLFCFFLTKTFRILFFLFFGHEMYRLNKKLGYNSKYYFSDLFKQKHGINRILRLTQL